MLIVEALQKALMTEANPQSKGMQKSHEQWEVGLASALA
jgi:hypothetical protein